MSKNSLPILLFATTLFISGCGDEGSQAVSSTGADPTIGCDGSCASAAGLLSTADVEQVLVQGIREARSRGELATLAVVDRVGNVLAVYRMGAAADREVLISTTAAGNLPPISDSGLEGIRLPVAALPTLNLDDQAAIAKAVTGAYLSSEGNAFTTRTANQIVQDHFNPGEDFQPGGPLFGVQFSQLACSDFSLSNPVSSLGPGPQRSPLGLSADPGGFPLYKGGTVVGGVGVMADGFYGIDKQITDGDQNLDELIALAATQGFAAPIDRRSDRITVEGKTLRFSDASVGDLLSRDGSISSLVGFPAGTGALMAVTGYFDGSIRAGTAFGQLASGVVPASQFSGRDAFQFVDAGGTPRFPARDANPDAEANLSAGELLSAAEVSTLLDSALGVANSARAQIRRPLNSQARVTISIVDTTGEILGMVRTRDAPMFGADVSLQKARTATFFSSSIAASTLTALPDAAYLSGAAIGTRVQFSDYVDATRSFLSDNTALSRSDLAFSDRAGGNLSRPFYPDGINGNPAGPLSKPAGKWSVFSTGLQSDIAMNAILQHVLFVAGAGVPDVVSGCGGVQLNNDLSTVATATNKRLANGIQIFPGSVPIYRGNKLVGGIGVSGDGVDQDDMIALLALDRASQSLGGAIANAPLSIRADNLSPQGSRLRYVQCPQSPFLNSAEDNVCAGK